MTSVYSSIPSTQEPTKARHVEQSAELQFQRATDFGSTAPQGRRAAAGSLAAVEQEEARSLEHPQHPPELPLAHAQLAVAAGWLPPGSVWGDAGDCVAASRTPELPLRDTNPQDRCVICGAGVRNRVRMPGPHPVLRLEGSTGCSQVRLEVEFKDGGAASSCHRWALPASATEISPGWRKPHFGSLGSPTCCADAGEGRVPC